MALPTRIFVVAAMALVIAWSWYATSSASRAGDLRYHDDPAYRLLHARHTSGVLRGTVTLGEGLAIPEGALVVRVRARDDSGAVAVADSVAVSPDGTFECFRLPVGRADLTIELGAGEVVWEAEGVAVDQVGVSDPRLDPVDLSGRVVPVDLVVLGPDDRPVDGGRLAWRRASGHGEDVTFGSPVPVNGGRAVLLAPVDLVDVVALVPGAAPEVFRAVSTGAELRLGPGTTVRVRATGDRPDPGTWSAQVVLHPLELEGDLEVVGAAAATVGGTVSAVLHEDGTAELPLVFGGRYQVNWFVERQGAATLAGLKLQGGEEIVAGSAQGYVDVDCAFPLDAFARAASARR